MSVASSLPKRYRALVTVLRSANRDAKSVTIVEDGQLLVGTAWVTPTDYQTDEIERHDLPSLKGSTPTEWPSLR